MSKAPTVRALSIRQPLAYAVVAGIKSVEKRTWPTNYVGPVLIHASKSTEGAGFRRFACGTPVPRIDFPLGAIVGAATVLDCVDLRSCLDDDPPGRYPKEYRTWLKDEPHASGPFCFVLDEPISFATPVPYTGQTGLFHVPLTLLSPKVVEYVRKATADCMPDTTVVNVRHDECDVYIGRACHGRKGSPFGNPFRGPNAVSAYKVWFEEKVNNDPTFRQAALALRGQTLGCWCAEPGEPLTAADKPFVCHGQVVADWVDKQPLEL